MGDRVLYKKTSDFGPVVLLEYLKEGRLGITCMTASVISVLDQPTVICLSFSSFLKNFLVLLLFLKLQRMVFFLLSVQPVFLRSWEFS